MLEGRLPIPKCYGSHCTVYLGVLTVNSDRSKIGGSGRPACCRVNVYTGLQVETPTLQYKVNMYVVDSR